MPPLVSKSTIIKNTNPLGVPSGGTANQVLVKDTNDNFKCKWVSNCCRPYKVYKALLTQSGTNAPTAIVLENTTGLTIAYDYTTVGEYIVNITGGSITPNKTIISLGNTQTNNQPMLFYDVNLVFNNVQLTIYTGVLEVDGSSIISTYADDLLNKNLLTIEIYP